MCCFNDNKPNYVDFNKNYNSFYGCGYGYVQTGKCPFCEDKRNGNKPSFNECQNGWGNCTRPCPEQPCWQRPCQPCQPKPQHKDNCVRVKFEGFIKIC